MPPGRAHITRRARGCTSAIPIARRRHPGSRVRLEAQVPGFVPPAQKFGAHVASSACASTRDRCFRRNTATASYRRAWLVEPLEEERLSRDAGEGGSGKVVDYGVFAGGFLDNRERQSLGRHVDVRCARRALLSLTTTPTPSTASLIENLKRQSFHHGGHGGHGGFSLSYPSLVCSNAHR